MGIILLFSSLEIIADHELFRVLRSIFILMRALLQENENIVYISLAESENDTRVIMKSIRLSRITLLAKFDILHTVLQFSPNFSSKLSF